MVSGQSILIASNPHIENYGKETFENYGLDDHLFHLFAVLTVQI